MTFPCRSCGEPDPEVFLRLGDMPLPDGFLTPEEVRGPEPRHPLDVGYCHACSMVQLVGDVSRDEMFARKYLYMSSFSDQVVEHARSHVEHLVADRGLGPDSTIVEIASNDGYLLQHVVAAGVGALGIDPAPEPTAIAAERGVPTRRAFFGRDLARQLLDEGVSADVVVANNVLAHVPDLDDVVEGIVMLLADDGVLTVENPNVKDLVERGAFDTIYHEHVAYWSCTSIGRMAARHGLHLQDVEEFPDLHGGTLRWWFGREQRRSDAVDRWLNHEVRAGVDTFEYYAGFADRVRRTTEQLRAELERLRDEGATVAAYGAAAKGTIMLNAADLGTDLVPWVVDRNVHKHGHHMPGTHQPILPVETLVERQPDVVLMLAWNFASEIAVQQRAYTDAGGRFLVPVPAVEYLT